MFRMHRTGTLLLILDQVPQRLHSGARRAHGNTGTGPVPITVRDRPSMSFGGDHPAHGHGKISPRCVPEGASDGKNTGSRQHIAAMYSDSANFGKICAPCIRKAPQSAVGECTARTSCRQGALSPSEALKSCTAHESCHPPMDLPLRRGSCPSNRIAGSPFNGLALAQGCLPPLEP